MILYRNRLLKSAGGSIFYFLLATTTNRPLSV